MGTPHPRGPSTLSPSLLLNQMRRDVWDRSHRRNLNPLTSCLLMRSLVSVGVSVKCLLNNSRLTAKLGGRGRRDEKKVEWDMQRGVDDRLMWGWKGREGGPSSACLWTARTDCLTCSGIAGVKGHEARRHNNNILSGLKPKEERASRRERRKKLQAEELSAHASCPLELSPPSVVVRYGDPVSINCTTTESVFEGIGWEATHGGTGVEKVSHLTWTVESLTEWAASPLCFFNPSEDAFPETISMSTSSDPHSVMTEMGEYNFICDIHNVAPVQNLTIRWYRGDTIISTDTFDNPIKEPVNQSSVFSFTPTRRDNGATFRCEAHLDLRTEGPQLNVSSEEFNITVNYGPDVQCSNIEVLEGTTLEEYCPVTGNPTPFVKWLKDGRPIDPSIPLSREKAGLYTIEAEGSSFVRNSVQVFVLYGPILKCPSNYTALEYTPLNFTCFVEGFPQPETTLYKDGEEVEFPGNLTRSDAGQYLITASNDLSSVNVTMEINVIYPPSPIVELEDSEVDVGSTVWLKCSSTGNPRPKYFWDYYWAANVMEEKEDGISRLVIHNATAYNTGSYTCHASNDRGNVSKTVKVTVKGAEPECPVRITLDRMVVQYQDSAPTATCTPMSTDDRNVEEISWQGGMANNTVWLVDTHKDWDSRPVCTATFRGIGTCQKHLNFILYKTPDSVSIRPVENLSSVVEDREFQLQCDITNVAPAQNLTVQWYRGNETIEPLAKGSLRVAGCLPESDTDCGLFGIRSPLNVSSTINVTLNRKHSGAEFRCEAQLDLGPEGPQPPPNMMSSPLNITVYYKPTINTTKLPKTIPVFRGYPEQLVCEADGHPPPKIQWLFTSDKVPHRSGDTLIVSEAGLYNCSATNEVDSITHGVVVILKEDYLPLIAGFVAVTVVAISIVFLFIYSIYYKNTKMRRYSLKNAKLNNTHSSNVAHNGWDLQFPMTKLSYGLIAYTGTPVSSSCTIQMSPPQVVVRFGDPFSASCSSSVDKIEGIGWESQYGGTGLQEEVSSLPLVVESVKDWSIDPQCFINLPSGEQCTQQLTVTVYKTPDSVSLSPPSQMGPLVEGQKYRMQCDIVDVAPVRNLSVYWHKGNEIFHSDTFDETTLLPVNKSSIFDWTAHRDDNGSQIWCEAKLNFEPEVPNLPSNLSKSQELIVLYPPAFANPEHETLELPAHGEITLNCTAAGNPMPVYSWHSPHAIQGTKGNQMKNQPIFTPSIQLPGTYNCTASNNQGTRIKYFTVIEATRNHTTVAALVGVLGSLGVLMLIGGLYFMTPEGTFPFCKGSYLRGQPVPSRVVVGFGEPVSVSCEAARPVRVLGWESAISAAHTQQDLSVQWKVDSLIDWIEEPICYGVFFTAPRQCEEKLNLVLYKTPDSVSIRQVNHTGPMVEGKEYQLLCEVQNIAPVQYLTLRWYKGPTEVYNHSFSDLTSSSPVQVSSILLITPTRAENGVQYRCVAELELGPEGPQPPPAVTSEPLNASVYFAPVLLNPEPEVVDLIAGAETTLNCTATGNPAPVYSWQSSHPTQQRMEEEDAVLTSSSLLPGTYTCTASNTLEKKSKQFIIKAQTKGV
ncbi:hemicentin-1 [Pempheris klunzingeri]|uniref:hemicentin-1 n=1 Tax=Pempheris klunzingeri TaxID=3127111 RepID=UPI00397F9894